MIVRIKFSDELIVMFGDSYKPWTMQMDEHMHRCSEGLPRPISAEYSTSKWISWGGLKWCSSDNFQHELNREGCQSDDPDNPNPRRYLDMEFRPVKNKVFAQILDEWESGQRLNKINKLSADEYEQFRRGDLKITI